MHQAARQLWYYFISLDLNVLVIAHIYMPLSQLTSDRAALKALCSEAPQGRMRMPGCAKPSAPALVSLSWQMARC